MPIAQAKIAKNIYNGIGGWTLHISFCLFNLPANQQWTGGESSHGCGSIFILLLLIFVVIADFQYLIIPDFFIILLSIFALFLAGVNWPNGFIAILASSLFFTYSIYGHLFSKKKL